MCGIAGIYNYHSPTEPSKERNIRNMLSVIRHRGPDESGMYIGENIGIGSVRLSIIDISCGQQPMCGVSGNFWIVYNGEIFNYKELRNESGSLVSESLYPKNIFDPTLPASFNIGR